VKLLRQRGHFVAGVDIGYFDQCAWEPLPQADEEITADFRTLSPEFLKGFDCVCHLAAISNDPMGDLDPKLTYEINRDGSIGIGRRGKQAGVRGFVLGQLLGLRQGESWIWTKNELQPVSLMRVEGRPEAPRSPCG
jgi:nucleoside-diphosphate-sugar epimerase